MTITINWSTVVEIALAVLLALLTLRLIDWLVAKSRAPR